MLAKAQPATLGVKMKRVSYDRIPKWARASMAIASAAERHGLMVDMSGNIGAYSTVNGVAVAVNVNERFSIGIIAQTRHGLDRTPYSYVVRWSPTNEQLRLMDGRRPLKWMHKGAVSGVFQQIDQMFFDSFDQAAAAVKFLGRYIAWKEARHGSH
jgi:hypothetical protein